MSNSLGRKTSENAEIRNLYYSEQSQIELPLSPLVKNIIRKKVNSYLSYQVNKNLGLSKQMISIKKIKPLLPKEFPQYRNIYDFLKEQNSILHLYKQKIQRNLDECLYFYLKILALAIDYQCKISSKQLDQEGSITIQAFIFISSSLQEIGAEKAAYYFAAKGIAFCQQYKILNPIGEFLFIMAKILRKLFKYKESIYVLKKSLEYTWWKDKTKAQILQSQFIKWLSQNNPDELDQFTQKYQVSRVINLQQSIMTNKSNKVDVQLKNYRDFFIQFLSAAKIVQQFIIYDIFYKKAKSNQKLQRALDLQIQIYNELSYNFLQLNNKQQSKIFAQKYQTGYTEPVNSTIINLSSQLIYSLQKRTACWYNMQRGTFELLFFVDLFQEVEHKRHLYRQMEQDSILKTFKMNFDTFSQSFMKKEMFQYEIPMPLQIKREAIKEKKKIEGHKFILKQKSTSVMPKKNLPVIIKKYTSQKVEENFIFNYRGIGISKIRLLNIYQRFMDKASQKEKMGFMRTIGWYRKQQQN